MADSGFSTGRGIQPKKKSTMRPELNDLLGPDFDMGKGMDLFQRSLTPVNVLERIRRDIIVFLGFQKDSDGRFSALEEQIIESIESVIRKGQCPSILTADEAVAQGLAALAACYSHEQVLVFLENEQGLEEEKALPVFASLIKTAREAEAIDGEIRKHRAKHRHVVDEVARSRHAEEIKKLRTEKDKCLILSQKIVFTHAAALAAQDPPRLLTYRGKPVRLDSLLGKRHEDTNRFFRVGRKAEDIVDWAAVEQDNQGSDILRPDWSDDV